MIVDHHQVDPERWANKALAVVNPAHFDCDYPSHLAGVGVAFKVLQSLNSDHDFLERYLALVAIGTVADCVSLTLESRTLVQLGLQALAKNYWPGVQALFSDEGEIDAETISFQIAPCLNAASRLGEVQHAVQLFIGAPERQSERGAYLQQLNEERRLLTAEYTAEAEALLQIEQSVQIIFLESCPVGVLGLVASRIVEQLSQPILVMTKHPHGVLHGSARSPKGLDIMAGLNQVGSILKAYGGHAGAAGFQLEESDLAAFIGGLQSFYKLQPTLTPRLEYEALVDPAWLNLEWLAWQNTLAPFGIGNPKPTWVVEGLKVQSVDALGRSGQHARLSFQGGHSAVAFFCQDLMMQLKAGQSCDVALTLNANTWNGQTKAQWQVTDVRLI